MSPQTSTVPPPDAGVGVLAVVLAVGTSDALEPTDWLPAEVAGDAAAAAVAVAVAVEVCDAAAVGAAFDFVAGLHAAEDNATTTTATAADSARTCIAAPCSGSVPATGRVTATQSTAGNVRVIPAVRGAFGAPEGPTELVA